MRPSSIYRTALQLLLVTASICEPALATRNAVAIYRCHVNGVLTFSDRPCDSAAEVHKIDIDGINTSAAPTLPNASRKAKEAPPKQKSGSARSPDPAKAAQACDRLEQSLRDIRSKMRSGYKASEGQRLQERQTKLKNQLRLARCS
jgi:hypothetical protein